MLGGCLLWCSGAFSIICTAAATGDSLLIGGVDITPCPRMKYVVALHLPRANGPSADTNSPVSRFPPLPPPAIAPCLFSRSFAVGRPVDGASLHVRAPSYQLDHVA